MGTYADDRIGLAKGPLYNHEYLEKPQALLLDFNLPSGQATNVCLEFKVPVDKGEYSVWQVEVRYRHNGITKVWRPKNLEVFRIIRDY